MSQAALEFKKIKHRYDKKETLKGIDLKVEPGEVLCLLGPSGCGKTTALRVAAGLENPAGGTVIVAGKEVATESYSHVPEERNVGLVFQDYALFPHLTIRENIAFGLKKVEAGKRQQIIQENAEQVGMSDFLDRYPHMLSGGQQQRIALARAMARNPDLILLDEPFSGLDARLRDQIRDNTLHVVKKTGAATMMVTHDAEEAMYMADRIAVMYEGRIIQIGTPSELYNCPVNSFVAEFFGDVNRFICPIRDNQAISPIGNFALSDVFDQNVTEAEVIIRPEAIKLKSGHQEENAEERKRYYARVDASRLLGRVSLVHLSQCPDDTNFFHIHARIPGQYLPEEGDVQEMEIDLSQVFVFPIK